MRKSLTEEERVVPDPITRASTRMMQLRKQLAALGEDEYTQWALEIHRLFQKGKAREAMDELSRMSYKADEDAEDAEGDDKNLQRVSNKIRNAEFQIETMLGSEGVLEGKEMKNEKSNLDALLEQLEDDDAQQPSLEKQQQNMQEHINDMKHKLMQVLGMVSDHSDADEGIQEALEHVKQAVQILDTYLDEE